ncbi:MAG TPA: hemolysin III family protein [Marmoricola sp.]|nr:hemolysin III family protein [Marmoricola sp.]
MSATPDLHGNDRPLDLTDEARARADEARERAVEIGQDVRERARGKAREVKPRLRGWLHAATTPLTLAAGIVLICLSPTVATRVGSAVFAGTALLLFTVSAIYHRGNWSPRTWAFLRRFDHSNIFLLIAGSYTPFALILLHGTDRVVLLSIVWGGALLGVVFKLFWTDAPRWLSTPVYVALGWSAIFYAHQLSSGGTAVTTLVVVGGGLYTIGGLVHGLRKPDPFPAWFGFHEIFHSFTIAAFTCHYVAASIATYSLR